VIGNKRLNRIGVGTGKEYSRDQRAKWMFCGTASTPIWESSMMNFTRTPNASEAVLGSQSIDAIKLNFIDHSRNAAATKLPSLAELLPHSARQTTLLCSRPARYADLETRSGAEMPVIQARAVRAARVRMIQLTKEREITPHVWVHPDNER
jgi:hypothetical protein